MVCQVCHRFDAAVVCAWCRGRLRRAPDHILPGGARVVAAFEHREAARVLMHHLKYRGLTAYADIVAAELRDRLPDLPVVPVPRAMSRRLRYGVDPAFEIAKRLDRPVLRLLTSPLHSPRRAGGDHTRPGPAFGLRDGYDGEVMVVDDVVTSGATSRGALIALGEGRVRLVAAANIAAGQITRSMARPSSSAFS